MYDKIHYKKKNKNKNKKKKENKMKIREFLGGMVVRTLHLHCLGPVFEPLLAN